MPGSHGSLTKAGKVRGQTPKVKSRRPKKKIPRVRNQKHYKQRILEQNYAGQPDSMGAIKAKRQQGRR
ncbi:MAG: 30S ribosomal protein S30e [Promethearchaeota archaeon]